ncbi:hypothetical protein a15_136 [Escherichia phage a15]|nr:hypothetical protein a15_136 [Escherichia phage a15]
MIINLADVEQLSIKAESVDFQYDMYKKSVKNLLTLSSQFFGNVWKLKRMKLFIGS